MLKSMTGFARVQESNASGSVTWEIRTVNHRYFEPNIKLPEDLKELEPEIRKCLTMHLRRGKVDVSLRYRLNPSNANAIVLNSALVSELRRVEQEVLAIVHEGKNLSVAEILGWPGVVIENEKNLSPMLELAQASLEPVLKQLVVSREAEGRAMGDSICTRCDQITAIVAQLRKHRPAMLSALREKWQNHLTEKCEQWIHSANPGRLEQELVILAQKLDVDEELERIDTHICEVKKVLDRDEAVGRRLDFLMQELNREANTLASKSQDSTTTQYSVDLKVWIEQMRELIQNIE